MTYQQFAIEYLRDRGISVAAYGDTKIVLRGPSGLKVIDLGLILGN